MLVLSFLSTPLAARGSDMARFAVANRQIEADHIMNIFSIPTVCVYDNVGTINNVPYMFTSTCIGYQRYNNTLLF